MRVIVSRQASSALEYVKQGGVVLDADTFFITEETYSWDIFIDSCRFLIYDKKLSFLVISSYRLLAGDIMAVLKEKGLYDEGEYNLCSTNKTILSFSNIFTEKDMIITSELGLMKFLKRVLNNISQFLTIPIHIITKNDNIILSVFIFFRSLESKTFTILSLNNSKEYTITEDSITFKKDTRDVIIDTPVSTDSVGGVVSKIRRNDRFL